MKALSRLAILFAMLLVTAFSFAQNTFLNVEEYAISKNLSVQKFPFQKMIVVRSGLNSLRLIAGEKTALFNNKEQIALPVTPIEKNGVLLLSQSVLDNLFTHLTTELQKKTEGFGLIKQPPSQASVSGRQSANTVTSSLLDKPQSGGIQPVVPEAPKIQATLISLTHISDKNSTSVFFDFNAPVVCTEAFEFPKFYLRVTDSLNLVPNNRTDPAGPHIQDMIVNSGIDNKGLIFTFTLPEKAQKPTVEYVRQRNRVLLKFANKPEKPSSEFLSESEDGPPEEFLKEEEKRAKQRAAGIPEAEVADVSKTVATESEGNLLDEPIDIELSISLESLRKPEFSGRKILIVPMHGGNQAGYVHPGRPPAKDINLAVATKLADALLKASLSGVLSRTSDTSIFNTQIVSFLNKMGTDLVVFIDCGASSMIDKEGIACIYYTPEGQSLSSSANLANLETVSKEWLNNVRLDLSEYLCKKIENRMSQGLKSTTRGVKKLPLKNLGFITAPAVFVEIGMLSHETEGRKLMSEKYQEAVALTIANGIIDFLNSIVLK